METTMKRYKGKSVLDRISIGKIRIFQKEEYIPEKVLIEDVEAECKRFQEALKKADEQLEELYNQLVHSLGEEEAGIVEVQRLMMQDDGFIEDIENAIKKNENAEYAVYQTGHCYSEMFAQMEDAYMRARSVDVLDISNRIVAVLANREVEVFDHHEQYILLANDLTPTETVQLDKEKLLGFITVEGSTNSHTAILARSLNLPALVKTDIERLKEWNGKMAIIDGYQGELIIDPEDEVLAEAKKKREAWLSEINALNQYIGKENITSDGKKINIYANIGNASDLKGVCQADAGGIGLFRSEFLYLGREDFPTEEEQFQSYKTVVEGMKGKKVIIRTLDIGADKKADYFELQKEENPAMGCRAIRICLTRPEIFKTQLRAIYRASAFGTVSIMFPMIISVQEIRDIKEIVEEVKADLRRENIPYGDVELGIMVETPAAAIVADDLAKEVEFFSIGTSDLTQYTLAIDRQNQNLDRFYDSHHPAILKLIQMTVEAGHRHNVWVGICGELAGDLSLTKTFIDMGVDELSVTASKVLKLRKKVCEL